MSDKAAGLVDKAKQWASYYGDFSNGPEGAVLTVPLRARAAWDANDADAFAALFTDNATMLAGDEQLKGPEQIRLYLAEAFAGGLKDTRIDQEPLEIRFLAPEVAFAVTQGGVVAPGQSAVAAADEVRTTWVLAKQNGDWRLVAHQTSPLRG